MDKEANLRTTKLQCGLGCWWLEVDDPSLGGGGSLSFLKMQHLQGLLFLMFFVLSKNLLAGAVDVEVLQVDLDVPLIPLFLS